MLLRFSLFKLLGVSFSIMCLIFLVSCVVSFEMFLFVRCYEILDNKCKMFYKLNLDLIFI